MFAFSSHTFWCPVKHSLPLKTPPHFPPLRHPMEHALSFPRRPPGGRGVAFFQSGRLSCQRQQTCSVEGRRSTSSQPTWNRGRCEQRLFLKACLLLPLYSLSNLLPLYLSHAPASADDVAFLLPSLSMRRSWMGRLEWVARFRIFVFGYL